MIGVHWCPFVVRDVRGPDRGDGKICFPWANKVVQSGHDPPFFLPRGYLIGADFLQFGGRAFVCSAAEVRCGGGGFQRQLGHAEDLAHRSYHECLDSWRGWLGDPQEP